MSDIKTIREWFETKLPDGYRERAIANTRENDLRLERYSFSSALSRAFCWTDSREGHDFWHQVCEYYAGDVWNLPPLPESKDAARVAASLADDPDVEDPYSSEEYQSFCEEMAEECECFPDCPCDGVLAGGPCDQIQREESEDQS